MSISGVTFSISTESITSMADGAHVVVLVFVFPAVVGGLVVVVVFAEMRVGVDRDADLYFPLYLTRTIKKSIPLHLFPRLLIFLGSSSFVKTERVWPKQCVVTGYMDK